MSTSKLFNFKFLCSCPFAKNTFVTLTNSFLNKTQRFFYNGKYKTSVDCEEFNFCYLCCLPPVGNYSKADGIMEVESFCLLFRGKQSLTHQGSESKLIVLLPPGLLSYSLPLRSCKDCLQILRPLIEFGALAISFEKSWCLGQKPQLMATC